MSSQAIRELCGRQIPVCWMSFGGWLSGLTEGLGHNNVAIRRAQFRAAEDPARCLALARRLVKNKIANCRTMLRRNHPNAPTCVLRELTGLVAAASEAPSLANLLGIEGNAGRLYFGEFHALIRGPGDEELPFDFTTRTRRPPKDPVNALLSLAYSLLAKDFTIAARTAGLDPLFGFYHQPRHARPALSLDLMEEFRPLIADSVVLTAINTGWWLRPISCAAESGWRSSPKDGGDFSAHTSGAWMSRFRIPSSDTASLTGASSRFSAGSSRAISWASCRNTRNSAPGDVLRQRYIVAYDVSDPKRLRQVFKTLKGLRTPRAVLGLQLRPFADVARPVEARAHGDH